MLKVYNYDIVFQEIPDEVTLALNISNCPNRCEGCHSPWLWEDKGEPITDALLDQLVQQYASALTCVCFMGGDADPEAVEHYAAYLKKHYPNMKTAWYSGMETLPESTNIHCFDYIKTGAYKAELGGLKSPNTNQRLYRITETGSPQLISMYKPK